MVDAAHTLTVITAFFAALSAQGDLARCFTSAVTLTTMATGEVVCGRDAVASLLHTLYRGSFEAAPVVRSLVAGAGDG